MARLRKLAQHAGQSRKYFTGRIISRVFSLRIFRAGMLYTDLLSGYELQRAAKIKAKGS
jgi:hypothetical protein